VLVRQEVKQIAGRAGRYGSIYDTGVVSTLHPDDLGHLHMSLITPDEPVMQAGEWWHAMLVKAQHICVTKSIL
jgi:hypothetical protein